MNRFWTLLVDVRVLSVIGIAGLAVFLFFGATALEIGLVYAGIALAAILGIWLVFWGIKRFRAYRAAKALEVALDESARQSTPTHATASELNVIHERMREAVDTIKSSKLGQLTGRAALYELPWYMVIGNPAAGKSTAVVKSGLRFPFADKAGAIIQGIGGTRNCDWFFTTEGILLDTAGRYSVHEEDRGEWLGFLALLKKYRSKAPINGIVIAVSVAELTGVRPESVIQLAKSLRQRVQELTENLEIFAPVYVVFTKVDLIAGFQSFFEKFDDRERERAWGATLPYDPAHKTDAVELFDQRFDELREGLNETMMSTMALHRGEHLASGTLSFPLEFAAIKPAVRSFISTLFEDNPYQFRPIFRGFYFTSAVQEGEVTDRVNRTMAEHFKLKKTRAAEPFGTSVGQPFFLRDLFSKVVFADRNLVKQYASRNKLRLRSVAFAGAALFLAMTLAGLGVSYVGNRQLMQAVSADLDKVVKLQRDTVDLAPRLEAMGVLQDRLRQLEKWRQDRPWSVRFGLYQGSALEQKLRGEYFHGVQQLMLTPVAQNLERYLADVNRNAGRLQPMTKPPQSAVQPVADRVTDTSAAVNAGGFVQASPTNVEDAYNALKTYLMLGDKQYMESSHLADQISRFWRSWLETNRGAMPNERLIQSAERMVSFSLENMRADDFPAVEVNLGLVDQTRENLRRVVRGMPARERVYSGIKARAATRFAPVTVASLVGEQTLTTVRGSHSISGAFTKQAWSSYIEDAIRQAANEELQSVDWVLKTASRDDLSLEGSPDQVRKTLTDMYKSEYVVEWQRFLQGVSVVEFGSFDEAVKQMDQLGDSNRSPVKQLMEALYEQTSWDNPSLVNERLAQTQRGFMQWFKQTILRQAPTRVDVNVNLTAGNAEVPMGPIGKEFSALQRIMVARDNGPTLMKGYLEAMGKLRSRFNQIKNQGDSGPAIKTLMAETLSEGNSELSAVLKYVDEQMLVGMPESTRTTLRPLLVRPLVQAFASMTQPVETELNRVWVAQVHEPFIRTLGGKYPFDKASRIEAAPSEVSKIFGAEGAVAIFGNQTLGPLVVRRGDAILPRTWADVGVRLTSEFVQGFPTWVAPLEATVGGSGSRDVVSSNKTVFQMLPTGSPGLLEYTIEIDGQSLRYRNTAATWSNFIWPNPAGAPGVRITGVTADGRTVEIFNEPGNYGLERLFAAAKQVKTADGTQLTWEKDGQAVTVQMRMVSQPGVPAQTTGSTPSGWVTRFIGLSLPALIAGGPASFVNSVEPNAAAASGVQQAVRR